MTTLAGWLRRCARHEGIEKTRCTAPWRCAKCAYKGISRNEENARLDTVVIVAGAAPSCDAHDGAVSAGETRPRRSRRRGVVVASHAHSEA